MVRRSQKTKNRMIDEVHWMQRKCAEIEKKEGQVREASHEPISALPFKKAWLPSPKITPSLSPT